MTSGSASPSGNPYQSFIEPGPYVIMVNPSFYNSITSTGESDIPVPPPPYNEQEHVTLDPPPDYSSISNWLVIIDPVDLLSFINQLTRLRVKQQIKYWIH